MSAAIQYRLIEWVPERQTLPFVEMPLQPGYPACQTCSKSELAERYHISRTTLLAWLKPVMPKLQLAGYHKNLKYFSPKMVQIIIDHLGEPLI